MLGLILGLSTVQCPVSSVQLTVQIKKLGLMFAAGFDGGLPANFLMEVYDTESMDLR